MFYRLSINIHEVQLSLIYYKYAINMQYCKILLRQYLVIQLSIDLYNHKFRKNIYPSFILNARCVT